MTNIFINNEMVSIPNGLSIYNACYIYGIQLPRFCYNETLAIAGNCRTCYVEIKNAPKLVVACAMTIADKMQIFTDSIFVKNGRANSFELILKNHPLDCPVCDQGGECDLQEHSYKYATDRSRFFGKKRSNHKIFVGLNIKTQMNRCITCTRCVRFIQLLNIHDLNTYGRGEATIISQLTSKKTHSYLNNIADLCPVGALTHSGYISNSNVITNVFHGRSWQRHYFNTINFHSPFLSPIQFAIEPNHKISISPSTTHSNANGIFLTHFISNKDRFHYNPNQYNSIYNNYITQDLNKLIKQYNPNNELIGWYFGENINLNNFITKPIIKPTIINKEFNYSNIFINAYINFDESALITLLDTLELEFLKHRYLSTTNYNKNWSLTYTNIKPILNQSILNKYNIQLLNSKEIISHIKNSHPINNSGIIQFTNNNNFPKSLFNVTFYSGTITQRNAIFTNNELFCNFDYLKSSNYKNTHLFILLNPINLSYNINQIQTLSLHQNRSFTIISSSDSIPNISNIPSNIKFIHILPQILTTAPISDSLGNIINV